MNYISCARRLLPALLLASAAQLLAVPLAAADKVSERFSVVAAVSSAPIDHGPFDTVLKTHVKPHADGVNRLDFASLKRDVHQTIKAYVTRLEAADPALLSRNDQIAYWINLYNAKTIDIVLSRYPVGSIMAISLPDETGAPRDGPWSAPLLQVSGMRLSLDDIERKILGVHHGDFRVHYALNCLSIGCPNLRPAAYSGAKLEAELDEAAADFVNHPRGISIEPGKVSASSIYEWYGAQLGGFDGVMAHMKKYARPELAARLGDVRQINFYGYDWALIDTSR
jgi:hypothetical protein